MGVAVGAALWAGDSRAAVPSFQAVKAAFRPSEGLLFDRHGELIDSVRVDLAARRLPWVALSAVSPALTETLVATEDRHFYEHDGVDWAALSKAALGRLGGAQRRGASTLSMQLAGLIEARLKGGAGGRSVSQKLDQLAYALALERSWTKAQILEAYLNLATFRGDVTGIAAFSAEAFGKYPNGLDRRESALAVALLRSPNASPAEVGRRACVILSLDAAGAACAEVGLLADAVLARRGYASALVSPHWAYHVAHRLLGAGRPLAVTTTLDARLQQFAEATLERQLGELATRHVGDGAVVVLDNATGDVLAWVGSTNAAASRNVDGVLALRQAGSTLKPFLYELAFEERWLTPASLLDDAPVALAVGGGLYVPGDYDHVFKGLTSARLALASSLNVPAVRTLVLVTPERLRQRLVRLGLPLRETGDYYGYSLALGSADVNLVSLTNAYRALAEGGRVSPWRLEAKVEAAAPQPALAADAVFLVSDILADREARALTFGLDSVLATPFYSAVKTGTSKDMRDNWCIGFSRRYTVGVWVGNADGTPMQDVSGVTGAAPVWRAVMGYLEGQGDAPGAAGDGGEGAAAPPPSVVRAHVRFAGDREAERDEWFLAGTESTWVAPAHAARVAAARIASPVDASIIALDPDIPPRAQRLWFATAGTRQSGTWWRLDGRALGAARAVAWPPWPGRHVLELMNAHGAVLEQSRFEVRGASVRQVAERSRPGVRARPAAGAPEAGPAT